jgi:hypothetical protein
MLTLSFLGSSETLATFVRVWGEVRHFQGESGVCVMASRDGGSVERTVDGCVVTRAYVGMELRGFM